MNIRELVSEFETADRELSQLLSARSEPSTNAVTGLDGKLERAFEHVVNARLDDSGAVLERIRFLISQFKKVSEDRGIAKNLGDKVIDDVKLLLTLKDQNSDNLTGIPDGEIDHPEAIIETSYTSKAVKLFSDDEILELCAQAQKFNQRNKITGALSYDQHTGSVFQILEGPAQTVQNLMDSIKNDIRHKDIKVRFLGQISNRNYDRWSMFLIPRSEMSPQAAN
ncbi:MAG: BLUF domain-containing protein [Rhizobiaceae bacterium]